MLRGTFNYPDLDVLDSPLISPTPLTSGIPGSALAERIFNDPDSWEDNQVEEGDFPVDVNLDRLSWLLAEEVEKFKRTSAISEKAVSLINTPTSAVHHNVKQSIKREAAGTGLKGIDGKKGSVRPISLAALFEHSNEDFSTEIQQQLSKILESGGIPHHIRPYPHSSALSPPSSSDTSSIDSPLQVRTAVTTNSGEISPSPINIYSASATLSFLEWYGIFPDSPRLDLAGLPQKSLRMKTPLQLQVPSPRHPVRPSSLLSSSETVAPPLPPAQRASAVPPPGLEPPPKETEASVASHRPPKTPSPPPVASAPVHADDTDQPPPTTLTRSESNSSEGRWLPLTAPPPYTLPPLPQPPIVRSSSSGSNNPVSSSRPRRTNGGSFDSSHIRRLPSIPPESSGSRPSTPQPHHEGPVERKCSLTRETPSPAPPSLSSSASNSPMSSAGQQADRRPVSSVRSPLGGPAGPRVRSRGGALPSISSTMGRRPPGLRL